MTGGNNRHTIGMGNKRKKIRFDWKNFICGSVNYTFSVAPLFIAALGAQATNGAVNPVYAFIAPTVAWLGENVKSVTLSDVEYNPDLKECFDEESKRALYRAWDKVFEKWVTELSDISDSDIDDLKKDSYEKIFHFEEDSGTAYIDKSLLTANEIKNLISTILQKRLNAEGTWEDEELNKIAEAVMMNFFVELELGIRKEPTLYNQLDIGEIKKSLGVIESKLKNMCSGENDPTGISTFLENQMLNNYKQYMNESIDFLKTQLLDIRRDTRDIKQDTREIKDIGERIEDKVNRLSERQVEEKNTIDQDVLCDWLKKRMAQIRCEMDWSVERYDGYQGYTPDYFTQMEAEIEVRIGSKRKKGYDNLLKCLKKYNKKGNNVFLVYGRPGSGKSTALIKLCDEMFDEVSKSGRIPIYINLKHWKGNWTSQNIPSVNDLKTFVKNELINYLKDKNKAAKDYIDSNFEKMCDSRRFYFLLDSFDEMPCLMGGGGRKGSDELINKISRTIYEFLAFEKHGGGVVASRKIRELSGDLRANIILEIQDLDIEHIKKTFENNRENKHGDTVLDARWFDYMFNNNDSLVALCSNPFYLTLLLDYCKSVDMSEGLPDNQMELYTHFIQNQIKRYNNKLEHKEGIIDTAKRLAILMHESEDSGLEYSCKELYALLGDEENNKKSIHDLDVMRICRLDEKEETVTFVHRRFYEFFLAKSMQDAELGKEGEVVFDYEEITKSNSELRDAMVLYCEIAPYETATDIARYCWQQLKDNIQYKNSLDGKGSIALFNTLYFMIDAFRNRKEAMAGFQEDYERLILDNCDKKTHFIIQLAFVSGAALFDKKGDNLPQLVLRTFEMDNRWLDEAIVESCWLIEKVDDRIETEFTDYFHTQLPREFISRFPSLSFTLSKSKGLRYVKRIHNLYYIWLRLLPLCSLLLALNSAIVAINHYGIDVFKIPSSSINEIAKITYAFCLVYPIRAMIMIKKSHNFYIRQKTGYLFFTLVCFIIIATIDYDHIDSLLVKCYMIVNVCMMMLFMLFELPWIVHDLFFGITRILHTRHKLKLIKKNINENRTLIVVSIIITAIMAICMIVSHWLPLVAIIVGIVLVIIVIEGVISAVYLIIRSFRLRHKDARIIKLFSYPKSITRKELTNHLADLSTVEYKIIYINKLLENESCICGEWPSSMVEEEGYRKKSSNGDLEQAMARLEGKSLISENRF